MDEFPYTATVRQAYMGRHPNTNTHVVKGYTTDHPVFGNDDLTTSEVQSMIKNEDGSYAVKTLNSLYKVYFR